MSFLSAAFLFALPLIAAPLLLHLFDRRRNVEIQWAAMQFLMAASARKTSARRVKQWLLLLLRTLAVAALIFALAQPLAPGGWIGGRQRSETIVVVDNSMSMMRSNGEATMMQTAIDRAIEELSDQRAGDRVRLMTAAPYPVWSQAGSMRTDDRARDRIASQIKQVQGTLGRSDLLAALFTAVQVAPEPTVSRRRVVVISDGQSTDWSLADEAGWNAFRQTLADSVIPTELQFILLENTAASNGNVAVDRVEADRTLVGINEPVRLTAHVRNHGNRNFPFGPVTWQVNAAAADETVIDGIEAGTRKEIQWSHSFSSAGAHQVTCRVKSDDDLVADNLASIVIEVVDRIPILVIEGSGELAEIQQDGFFVQAALGWVGGEPLDGRAVFAPTSVALERISSVDLSQFRVVVIPNLTALDGEVIESLKEFVVSGGGIWVGLGPRTDIDAFNQQWFAAGNGLSPLGLDRIVDDVSRTQDASEQATAIEDSPGRARTTINPFGKEHPATTQLADNEQLDIGDVIVSRRFRFLMPEHESETSVLLGLSNGQPLVVENLLGRGRVLVQAVPLRLQWSDLARSQSFVVMVRDWIDYLSQPRATQFNLQPGDPIVLRVPNRELQSGTLTLPQGDSIELAADALDEGVVFRSSRTSLPGDYRLEIGVTGEQIPFHVGRDSRESDLSPLQADEQKLLTELAGLKPGGTDLVLAGSTQTDPLWPYLLIGLVVLISCELFLSGLLARERFGSSGVSETNESWLANRGAPLLPEGSGDQLGSSFHSPLAPSAQTHEPVGAERQAVR